MKKKWIMLLWIPLVPIAGALSGIMGAAIYWWQEFNGIDWRE